MNDESDSTGMIGKTFGGVRRAWQEIRGAARVRMTGALRPDLPKEDLKRIARRIDECIDGSGGEVSARARAADLGRCYLSLSAVGREKFFRLLADEYGVDEAALSQAVRAWTESHRSDTAAAVALERRSIEGEIRDILTPPRVRLLSRFNSLPDGVKFLVDMRAELLGLCRGDPSLEGLEQDLKRLLASWFDVGFLELQCITWGSPASLLEKLAAYEAVHAVESWSDIKNRLGPDRRCYAFFHPQMPGEPLIFVWVALVKGTSGNIRELLDEEAPTGDPDEADTAVSYSISNAQQGLAGISLGNFLIKRVIDDLSRDFKNLKKYATLSPIPGYVEWLAGQVSRHGDELLQPAERRALADVLPGHSKAAALAALAELEGWHQDDNLAAAVEPPLMRLCALYLTTGKRGKHALDKVAHFHLSNGARLERVNWLADTSAAGMRQSLGIMVNYLYDLGEIEDNHEAYWDRGEIKTSGKISALLKTTD